MMTTQPTTNEQPVTAPAEEATPVEPARTSAPPSRAATDGDIPPMLAAALALLVPAVIILLLPPLSRAGLWDPPELNVADMARRLAVNLYGASNLALSGTDNSLPHLNDLGKPELPFTSIALGFKLFGLHEWAGRLPLGIWALAGIGAVYASLARLIDRRAGVYAAVVLATTPLYTVQARTMIGDIVIMSAVAMSFLGLVTATLEGLDRRGALPRLGFLAVALAGLAAGYYSRGLALGVTAPLLSAGLLYALVVSSLRGSGQGLDAFGHAVGGLSLVLAIATMPTVYGALDHPDRLNMSTVLGGMIRNGGKFPTHDFMLGQVAHAMAPWSAFAAFAFGRLFFAPKGTTTKGTAVRASLLIAFAVVFVMQGFVVGKVDATAFAGPALAAAACGIALRDYERGAHSSIAVGVGTFLLLFLFRHDFKHLPDKAFQVFGVTTTTTFPESFKNTSVVLWAILLMGFAAVTLVTWGERSGKRTPFDAAMYLKVLRALREAWDGLLSLVYFALVAGASLAGLLVFLGARTKLKWIPVFPKQVSEYLLNAWWIAALAPFAVVFGLLFVADVWVWAFDRSKPPSWGSFTRGFEPFEELFARLKNETDKELRVIYAVVLFPLMVLALPAAVGAGLFLQGTKPAIALALAFPSGIGAFLVLGAMGELVRGSRAAGMVILGGGVAAAISGYYYPALANQLSPKEVFESYTLVRKSGEPLGLFGVGSRTAAYYAGGQPPSFSDAPRAFEWLVGAEGGERRYLAMRADELGRLNKVYRERLHANVPVLDGRSSQIILATSRLVGSEKSQSPLDKVVLATAPKPQRPLGTNLDDKLEVIGIDLLDASGRLVDVVSPGRKYQIKTYYRCLGPVTSEWEAFIHIDGFQRRHNGDHKIMQGKYPFGQWLKDDILVDIHEFQLEPNFSPGNYTIYMGLFLGESRMKVKSGPSDGDNRVLGGSLRVQ